MAAFDDVVIISGCRTPVGKFQGSLADFSAPKLGAIVVREAVKHAALNSDQVDECIMGNVLPAGLGQNPARQAAIFGGLSPATGAMTINKVCGSGLKAVALAAQAVQTGNSSIVVAGGMESMTNAPYLLPQARKGYRLGNGQVIDSMVHDGLWDIYNDYHMGITGENVAEKYGITREEQDEFAVHSHRKAVAAMKECRFKSQIVPVEIPAKKKGEPPVLFEKDESPREDTTIETLRSLKPAFKKDGTVTAGNAPGVNDGAAAVVVTSAKRAKELGVQPMVRIVAQATSGVEPKWVMMAPVDAVRKIWEKTGWKADDVDLYELNEAFSVQALGVMRELGLDPHKVNVNGGAVAIGHPIGASGARVLVTLIYEMIRRDVKRGIAALCLGGGNAVAMAVERD
ncbi:MAG TPA: acetyl-CoA C-acetyltransferase [Candidatus Dormibacteraeota bacterium]|jgi:acetyl-CoA C-acetyltransferase|nr:acetyl-CoA C-acetyltransferase [Candidatus Dormibacteraeota bacterium]